MSMADRAQFPRVGTTEAVIGYPPKRGRWWRMFFSGIWLIYLIQPVAHLFGEHRGALYTAPALVMLVAFCVIYVLLLNGWDQPGARPYWGLAALVALTVTAALVYGGGGGALWIYISAACGIVIPERRLAMRVVLGVTAGYVLFSWIGHVDMTNFLITLLPVVLVGWAMVGFRMQIELTRQLAQARETVAKLAANGERLRLARDMHDLTGQSLSMITLKSELAAKLLGRLPASADRDRASEQIAEVAQVSRQTLHDIREAVSGYRRPTLAVEIITARTALEAAGIDLDDDPQLTLLSGTFDAEAEAVLAWCLREAVTNVIRHSGARNCQIRLTRRGGDLSLEVRDDGHGYIGPSRGFLSAATATPVAESVTPAGSGLHGMSERLDAVGGRLTLNRAASGFSLAATVPAVPAPPRNPLREDLGSKSTGIGAL